MTIDGPVALFKSSTNCSRAPFSAPGPYCWSGPLKARPGPKPPEAPARAQPCASPRQPAGSQPGSPGAAGDPAAHSSAPRRPSHRRHRYRRRPGRDSATEKQRAPKPVRARGWAGAGDPRLQQPGPWVRKCDPALGPCFPETRRTWGAQAGGGERGVRVPRAWQRFPRPGLRRPTRAILGTPGRDRRRHTPGAMGIPTQGRDPRACSSTLPGWAATAERLRGTRSSGDLVRCF